MGLLLSGAEIHGTILNWEQVLCEEMMWWHGRWSWWALLVSLARCVCGAQCLLLSPAQCHVSAGTWQGLKHRPEQAWETPPAWPGFSALLFQSGSLLFPSEQQLCALHLAFNCFGPFGVMPCSKGSFWLASSACEISLGEP